MPQVLVLFDRFPSLNKVIEAAKQHHGAYATLKKHLTMSVAIQARAAKLKPVEGKVEIRFRWLEENRRRDPDNVRHGAKYILDGLVEAGVLQDDSQKYIAGLSDTFKVDKSNPRVEVEILTMEEDSDGE